MWLNPQETTDLVTFTEEILNRKPYFSYSDHNFCNAFGKIAKTWIKINQIIFCKSRRYLFENVMIFLYARKIKKKYQKEKNKRKISMSDEV